MYPELSKQLSPFFVILLAFLLTSCDPEPITPDNSYSIPEIYNFTPADYSGQTTRLAMLNEMKSYMAEGKEAGTVLDAQRLQGMYINDATTALWSQEYDATKQLKSKTFEGEQEALASLFPLIAEASESVETASEGVAGRITSTDGNSTYLLGTNGLEYAQIIEKGLMGACIYYQATTVYLGPDKMNVDNEAIDPDQGTAMQHHWDEAFGYYGVPIDFPLSTTGAVFWGNYSNGRDELLGCNQIMMDAFLAGRAAIDNSDYDSRDAAIETIRGEWERICAATAIHYLNSTVENFDDFAKRAHQLSEGIAFIYSLQFNAAKTIDNSMVSDMLVQLAGSSAFPDMDIYPTTVSDILAVRDQLAEHFSLVSLKEQL